MTTIKIIIVCSKRLLIVVCWEIRVVASRGWCIIAGRSGCDITSWRVDPAFIRETLQADQISILKYQASEEFYLELGPLRWPQLRSHLFMIDPSGWLFLVDSGLLTVGSAVLLLDQVVLMLLVEGSILLSLIKLLRLIKLVCSSIKVLIKHTKPEHSARSNDHN